MMGGVSPKTCRASYQYEIKMLVHCCILLDFLCELYYDARMHEHQGETDVCFPVQAERFL
jgi:hypothetical protein